MSCPPQPHAPTRRTCLQAALASWLSPALAGSSGAAPAAFVSEGRWLDASRQRSLPWRLRLPAATEGAGPFPLVLFSHGLGGSVDAGTVWGEAWAAAGLAVLHLQHPGSDTDTLRGGLRQLQAAASAEQFMARVLDVRFVLDELTRRSSANEPPWAQLRLDAVGLAGHSFGAQTTQAIAGQRFAAGGDAADPRPRAFIAFSPSQPRGGRLSLAQAFGGITRPLLLVTGSEDGDPFGSYAGGQPRAEVYDGLPPEQRALLWLDGADHMSFSGQNLRHTPALGPFRRHGPAAERQAAHHALVARITIDWWRAQLLGDTQARDALRQPAGLGGLDRWRAD